MAELKDKLVRLESIGDLKDFVSEKLVSKVDIPVPAKVGQIIAVSEVDEDGRPTGFEATDQGGGVSDEKIAEAVGTYMEAHPIEESDPTVSQWAKQPEKPSYTASEVGADAAGTAEIKVSAHNTSDAAHNDIRLLVQGLTARLNALADSDDTTLDQMSEVVAYIKSNKSLIDAITTSKVNVSDIIDNLTTNMSNKPLSAAQGVALKALIDGITTVELDETLTDNTKAAPAGVVGELKQELANVGKPTDEQISTAVREYLSENPVFDEEKDPTVSEWAKKELGTGLTISDNGKLTVDIAESVEEDNTKPVTSGAVYTVLGNIETLLSIL